MKKLIAFLIIFSMLSGIGGAYGQEKEEFIRSEISKLDELNLGFAGFGYQEGGFKRIGLMSNIIKTYEGLTGKEIPVGSKFPFRDAGFAEAIKAYNIGIAKEKEPQYLYPNDIIDRAEFEEAYTSLINILETGKSGSSEQSKGIFNSLYGKIDFSSEISNETVLAMSYEVLAYYNGKIINAYDGSTVTADIYRNVKSANADAKTIINNGFTYEVQPVDKSDIDLNYYDRSWAVKYKSGYYGVIDKSGKVILPYSYNHIYTLNQDSNNVIAIDNNGGYLIDAITGEKVIDDEFQKIHRLNDKLIQVSKNSKWALMNYDGIILSDYDFDSISKVSETIYVFKNGKSGVVNDYGKTVIEIEYDSLNGSRYGIYIAIKDGETILIDEYGNVFDSYSELYENYYKVNIAGKSTVYYIDDKKSQDLKVDDIGKMLNGYAVVSKNNKYGVIDDKQNIIVDSKYDEVMTPSEGYSVVKINGKWDLLNINSKTLMGLNYEKIHPFSEGYAAVKKNGLWGYIDKSGKEVIKAKYTWAGFFSEGFAQVEKSDKFGYINTSGKEITKFIYEATEPFYKSTAAVKRDGKWGKINKFGTEIVKVEFYNILKPQLDLDKENYFVATRFDYKQQLISPDGKPLPAKASQIFKWDQNHVWLNNSGANRLYNTKLSKTLDIYGDFFDKTNEYLLTTKVNGVEKAFRYDGEKAVELEYKDLGGNPFVIATKELDKKDHLGRVIAVMGILDYKGDEIVKAEYDSISKIAEEIFIAKKGNLLYKITIKATPDGSVSKYIEKHNYKRPENNQEDYQEYSKLYAYTSEYNNSYYSNIMTRDSYFEYDVRWMNNPYVSKRKVASSYEKDIHEIDDMFAKSGLDIHGSGVIQLKASESGFDSHMPMKYIKEELDGVYGPTISIRYWITEDRRKTSRNILSQNAFVEILRYFCDSDEDANAIYQNINTLFVEKKPYYLYGKVQTFGDTQIVITDPGVYGVDVHFIEKSYGDSKRSTNITKSSNDSGKFIDWDSTNMSIDDLIDEADSLSDEEIDKLPLTTEGNYQSKDYKSKSGFTTFYYNDYTKGDFNPGYDNQYIIAFGGNNAREESPQSFDQKVVVDDVVLASAYLKEILKDDPEDFEKIMPLILEALGRDEDIMEEGDMTILIDFNKSKRKYKTKNKFKIFIPVNKEGFNAVLHVIN